jgi:hypothetical protein
MYYRHIVKKCEKCPYYSTDSKIMSTSCLYFINKLRISHLILNKQYFANNFEGCTRITNYFSIKIKLKK